MGPLLRVWWCTGFADGRFICLAFINADGVSLIVRKDACVQDIDGSLGHVRLLWLESPPVLRARALDGLGATRRPFNGLLCWLLI